MKTAQERQRVYVFETSQKTQIGALVAAYRPSLANHDAEITLANQKRRVKQVTNEDRLRLQGNLVNCRRALIEQNLVKRPPVGANGESGTIHTIYLVQLIKHPILQNPEYLACLLFEYFFLTKVLNQYPKMPI